MKTKRDYSQDEIIKISSISKANGPIGKQIETLAKKLDRTESAIIQKRNKILLENGKAPKKRETKPTLKVTHLEESIPPNKNIIRVGNATIEMYSKEFSINDISIKC